MRPLLEAVLGVAVLACAETPVAQPSPAPQATRSTPSGCVAPDGSLAVEPPAEYRVFAPVVGIDLAWQHEADGGPALCDE